MSTLTLVQEVFFDISDLLDGYQVDDIQITGFSEFETLREFLLEQRRKLQAIEESLAEVSDET